MYAPLELTEKPRVHRSINAAAHTSDYVFSQLIPYLGNKRKLLGLIDSAIQRTGFTSGIFADLFSGSGVVSRYAKRTGFQVISNDWEPYSFEINNCFVRQNCPPNFKRLGGFEHVLTSLNSVKPIIGWTATHLCPDDDLTPDMRSERMFFTRANGMKIDAIRQQIADWEADLLIDSFERSYLLAPLLYGASYVSNTSGVFKGFHNGWGGKTGTALYRILSDIELRTPILFGSKCDSESWQMDAKEASKRLKTDLGKVDIAYLDPPYNQHPYGSNYHVLNSIALWDKPELTAKISKGQKSAIRTDWRTERRSAYNHRSDATEAFGKLIDSLDARWILVSYSTDGIIPLTALIRICASRGSVSCVKRAYKRYRVSTQRMSEKAMNVEFVLIVDTSNYAVTSIDRVHDEIITAEEAALEA